LHIIAIPSEGMDYFDEMKSGNSVVLEVLFRFPERSGKNSFPVLQNRGSIEHVRKIGATTALVFVFRLSG
jgi:hypothetical protein